MRSRKRLDVRRETGSALVETTLVLPVILMVMLGIAEFGIAFRDFLLLTDAVRASGRTLAVSRGQTTNPCQGAVSRLYASATGLDQTDIAVTLNVNGTNYSSGTCPNVALNGGAVASVTASYPCEVTIFGIDFAPGCQLQSNTTIRIE
jgi:Flp pilus assembly protein TadG